MCDIHTIVFVLQDVIFCCVNYNCQNLEWPKLRNYECVHTYVHMYMYILIICIYVCVCVSCGPIACLCVCGRKGQDSSTCKSIHCFSL